MKALNSCQIAGYIVRHVSANSSNLDLTAASVGTVSTGLRSRAIRSQSFRDAYLKVLRISGSGQ